MLRFPSWLTRSLKDAGLARSSRTCARQYYPHLEGLEQRENPVQIFVVLDKGDTGVDTLRWAIEQANATPNQGGPDIIRFAIDNKEVPIYVGKDTAGKGLDPITEAVTFEANPPNFENQKIILRGDNAAVGVNGLTIQGNGSKIKGVSIVLFPAHGIQIRGQNNEIESNYIGTDAASTTGLGNKFSGIHIDDASFNTVGGSVVQANFIMGNSNSGVLIENAGAKSNTISYNWIGGLSSLGNGTDGIFIRESASSNYVIGNTVVGNAHNGVLIGKNAFDNYLWDNFIGTNILGSTDRGNTWSGVSIDSGATLNHILGGNTISGNKFYGVNIAPLAGIKNEVKGSRIGTDPDGKVAIPNKLGGLLIESSENTIGGPNGILDRNIITGNDKFGIYVLGDGDIRGRANKILGNYIGVLEDGVTAIGNAGIGVVVSNVKDTVIGGATAADQNTIAGNIQHGIWILADAKNTIVQKANNFFNGPQDLKNQGQLTQVVSNTVRLGAGVGVAFNSATGATSQNNSVYQNQGDGVVISDSSSTLFEGDFIGTDASGTPGLGNQGAGIRIESSSNNNTIGGIAITARAKIANNIGPGVNVVSGTGNSIRGNSIYGNGGIGIDLGGDGVTPNDYQDVDTGPNNLQNYPILMSAYRFGDSITVQGSLNSTPNTLFTLDVYGDNAATLPEAEGRFYLGTITVLTDANGDWTFLETFLLDDPSVTFAQVTSTATDPLNNTSEFSAAIQEGGGNINGGGNFVAVAPDAGRAPLVRVYDTTTHRQRLAFYAFPVTFTGGVRVAMGDVNGDRIPDIIAAAGPGGGGVVKVFSGASGSVLYTFSAGEAGFTGGINVAAGDVNGDGKADVIAGMDAGGVPRVRVFSGANGAVLYNFVPYDAGFRGGVRVAAGDVNADGKADIITSPGAGIATVVKIYSGASGALLSTLNAFGLGYTGGAFIAAGDVNGDGRADIIVGSGAGSAPLVNVYSGSNGALLKSFLAYDATFTGGVRVAARDVNGDGIADILVGGGSGSREMRIYDGLTTALLDRYFAYEATFNGGLFVG